MRSREILVGFRDLCSVFRRRFHGVMVQVYINGISVSTFSSHAEQRRRGHELRAGQLHSVTGVPAEEEGHPVELLPCRRRLGHGDLFLLLGFHPVSRPSGRINRRWGCQACSPDRAAG